VSDCLPEAFVSRMGALLDDELPSFLEALRAPRARGLRVNPRKVGAAELGRLLSLRLDPLPRCPLGFTVAADVPLGGHPAHVAGLYYGQDPAAMAVVERLEAEPGWRVADVAAAPGGKTTHLLSMIGPGGLVLANEVSPPRLGVLHENLDRWGAPNVVTAGAALNDLASWAPGWFDAALLDAPCSGEAMMWRGSAITQWSPAAVSGSARRQARLLEQTARLVRPGGLLLYSTCTFERDENEDRVAAFLDTHPEWELAEPELRLWPHRDPGEGQYVARLRRRPGAPARAATDRPRSARRPGRDRGTEVERQWEAFVRAVCPDLVLPPGRLLARGSRLYQVPTAAEELPLDRLARPGLELGVVRPGRFQPSQALACFVDPHLVPNRVSWAAGDRRLEAFLRGEAVEDAAADGWVLVCYERWGLGWGRRRGGIMKNFLPPRARTRSRWGDPASRSPGDPPWR